MEEEEFNEKSLLTRRIYYNVPCTKLLMGGIEGKRERIGRERE